MTRILALFGLILVLSGCTQTWSYVKSQASTKSQTVATFWRPISEPNILLPLHKAQKKLVFDLTQCDCAMFPTNAFQPDLVSFQPDKQRYVETSITRTKNGRRSSCTQQPSLVVSECMRVRGWESTSCTGRMPLVGGGAMCAAAVIDD